MLDCRNSISWVSIINWSHVFKSEKISQQMKKNSSIPLSVYHLVLIFKHGFNANWGFTSSFARDSFPTMVWTTYSLLACPSFSFIKVETLKQVFSCEFWEILKNTFFVEHLWTIASYKSKIQYWKTGSRSF